jgi:hypothetical protein
MRKFAVPVEFAAAIGKSDWRRAFRIHQFMKFISALLEINDDACEKFRDNGNRRRGLAIVGRQGNVVGEVQIRDVTDVATLEIVDLATIREGGFLAIEILHVPALSD